MFKRILMISSTEALPVAQFELLSRINRRADNNFAYTRQLSQKCCRLLYCFCWLLTVHPEHYAAAPLVASKNCLEEEFHTKASVLHHECSLCNSKTELLRSSVALITLELYNVELILRFFEGKFENILSRISNLQKQHSIK